MFEPCLWFHAVMCDLLDFHWYLATSKSCVLRLDSPHVGLSPPSNVISSDSQIWFLLINFNLEI
jgi:hypothetical protein